MERASLNLELVSKSGVSWEGGPRMEELAAL